MRKDLFYTFLTEFVVLIAGLLVYFFGARLLTMDELGQYMLVRRITTPLLAIVLLGIAVALPRYLAISINDERRRKLYATSGFLMMLISIATTVLVLNFFHEFFSELLFGDRGYAFLVFPMSLLMAATALSASAYSYYRGRLLMPAANSLHFLNMGIFVLLAILLFHERGAGGVISLTALMILFTGALFAAPIVKDAVALIPHVSFKELKDSASELFIFGIGRVPGFVGMFGLLAVGPILLAHFASMGDVVYYSAGLSILGLLSASVSPFGLIFLPRFANMIASGKINVARDILNRLVAPLFMIALFAVFQLIAFADIIIRLWLGHSDPLGVMIFRVVILCAPFRVVHALLRNPVDAAHVKPINTRNIFVSLAVFATCVAASLNIPVLEQGLAISISLCCALIALGFLSYLSAKRLYGFSLELPPLVLIVTLLFGGIAIAAAYVIAQLNLTEINSLVIMVILEAILVLSYLGILWKVKVEWIRNFYREIKALWCMRKH